MKHNTIFEAINAVMEEVGYVRKSKSANLNYTFAGEAALISAIRPAMVENGIFMYVACVKSRSRENYTTKKGAEMVNTVIEGVVRFQHIGGTHIDVEATGEGSDSGDKSSNKALTGLYKYAMRQTFCIETGDDPDKHSSEERAQSKPQQASKPTRQLLLDKYSERYRRATELGISAKTITPETPDDVIITLGKELKALIEAAEEAQKQEQKGK